jgi:hypothetical protein
VRRLVLLGSGFGGAGAALIAILACRLASSSVGLGVAILASGLVGVVAAVAGDIAASQWLGVLASRLDASIAENDDPPRSGWPAMDNLIQASWSAREQDSSEHDELLELRRLTRGYVVAARGIQNAAIDEQEIRRGMEEAILEVQSADRLMVRVIEVLNRATSGLTAGASEQADVLTRTATTVETISKMIDKISANAEEASTASDQTRTEAVLGLDRVRSAIEGMDRLRVHVANNRRQIRRLGDRSVEIGSIVDLIANIAQRTELLALNATMESVRAGAEGRGFAAVAEEIRALAERAAAAGRDIGELVGAIASDMRESIRALDEEQAEVDRESTRVRDAGVALERISSFADRSADLVEGISQATHYQVEAAHDLVRAAQTISDIAHRAQEGAEFVEDFIEEVGLNGKRSRVLANGNASQPKAKGLNGLGRGAISVRLP